MKARIVKRRVELIIQTAGVCIRIRRQIPKQKRKGEKKASAEEAPTAQKSMLYIHTALNVLKIFSRDFLKVCILLNGRP